MNARVRWQTSKPVGGRARLRPWFWRVAGPAGAALLLALPSLAAVPGTIGHQGRLYDANTGDPVEGELSLSFALYESGAYNVTAGQVLMIQWGCSGCNIAGLDNGVWGRLGVIWTGN